MRAAFRFVRTVLKSFLVHSCGLHAAGLTYFSLMAIVPVLCLLMVFAKMCGVDDFARRQIAGCVDAFIVRVEQGAQAAAPEAAAGGEATPQQRALEEKFIAQRVVAEQLRGFVDPLFDRIDAFDVRTFGWIGLAMLLWTGISTLGQIELTMNEIWEVDTARPLWQRCALYLFVAGVVPLLAAGALSLPVLRLVKSALEATLGVAACTRWLGQALMVVLDSRLFAFVVTLLFATLVFAFLHAFMPNRRVNVLPALGGGFFTALALGAWVKLCTAAQVGIGKSSAFYGSFATPVIVLAWIYMSWQIVLLGATVTHALQHFHTSCASGDARAA